MGKYVIRSAPTGVKFDLRAANGQTVATSEVYSSPALCRKGMESVRRCAPLAELEDQTQAGCSTARHPKFQLYRDRFGAYRFRLTARNGKIIAISEGYSTRQGCLAGIESVRQNASSPVTGGEENPRNCRRQSDRCPAVPPQSGQSLAAQNPSPHRKKR